ncbi:hypothetical protein K7432_017528 [Basidiobolus ranarum]|uniref:Uncharacterized protein n=1 Tax=Basidiobolus ranarum TaxID=34480 RepID=A0ABR2VLA4_9FUNG
MYPILLIIFLVVFFGLIVRGILFGNQELSSAEEPRRNGRQSHREHYSATEGLSPPSYYSPTAPNPVYLSGVYPTLQAHMSLPYYYTATDSVPTVQQSISPPSYNADQRLTSPPSYNADPELLPSETISAEVVEQISATVVTIPTYSTHS